MEALYFNVYSINVSDKQSNRYGHDLIINTSLSKKIPMFGCLKGLIKL